MIILLLLFLLIVPFFVGRLVRRILDYAGRGILDVYLCGVMTMFVVSGGLHVLMMFLHRSFSDYEKMYAMLLSIMALAGVLLMVLDVRKNDNSLEKKGYIIGVWRSFSGNKETQIFSILTVLVLVLCVIRIFVGTTDLTGDFTLETIRTTLRTDSIYQYNSLTGIMLEEGMPIRQQILTMPFFLAFLSDVFQVEANVLLYKIFPCYTLFLTILIYVQWGGVLFSKQRERRSVFLFVVSVLLLVGDYAQAAPAALILHQGFTGNAICAGMVIPFAIYACMNKKWLLAGLCAATELFLIWTTYGLGFCALVIFIFALIELVGKVIKK